MAGRKLIRVQPQQPPAVEAVPVPTPPKVEHIDATRYLNRGAAELCVMWDRSDAQMKKILLPSMMELMHAIRAAALENGGFGKNRGEARDVYRAKYAYLTGRTFSAGREQCTSITKSGARCKNYPMIGVEHCHTPGHASDEERKQSWALTLKWQAHFELMVRNIGCVDAYMALSERITRTREL